MTRPSWRGFLATWRDRDCNEERLRYLDAVLARHAVSADHAGDPPEGRLSGLRGPLEWLSIRPAMQTTDGRIVARPARVSWGRDGVWLRWPMCRVGIGHWAVEEWIAGVGWVRPREGPRVWPGKRAAVLPGMDPIWRRCGVEDLVPSPVGVRHIRAALVHWRPIEAEVRAASIAAADLVPLLGCPDLGVREGALQALAWVIGVDAHDQTRG